MKIKCCASNCNLLANWIYLPVEWYFLCEQHVPRGCSCQENLNADSIDEQNVDIFGRLLPCVEFDYSLLGFDYDPDTDEVDYRIDNDYSDFSNDI